MQTNTMTYQAAKAHHTELHRTAAVRRSAVGAHSDSSLLTRLSTLIRGTRTSPASQATRKGVVVGRFAI